MAIATSTIIGLSVAAGTGAASLYAAKKQGDANKQATEAQERSNTAATEANERMTRNALQFEREKEARRQQEWDRMMQEEEARWNAEQARLAPYRAASEGALAQLVDLAGLPAYTPTPVEKPNFDRPMPTDWQPGDPTGIEVDTQDRAVVRKPSSARLTDLLRDPHVSGGMLEAAAAIGDEAVDRASDQAPVPSARVSPEAYRRVGAEAGEPGVPARVSRRRPLVSELVRPRDMFQRSPTSDDLLREV